MISAGVSAVVLAPLGWAKYRTGQLLHSHALMDDGTLSAMGAALGILALLGLLTDQLFGWWWADRIAALAVAAVATVEAIRVMRVSVTQYANDVGTPKRVHRCKVGSQ